MLTTEKILEIWATAHEIASDNTGLLLLGRGDLGTIISDLCSARMDAVDAADQLLATLLDRDDNPTELKNYFEAEKDKGCQFCWHNSCDDNIHPACKPKIARWFECRGKLFHLYKRQLSYQRLVDPLEVADLSQDKVEDKKS